MEIEIKRKLSGNLLFALECGSMKLCLEAAIKSKADLREADLTEADLTGADLTEADLRGADLRRADLREADLTEADLRGANLRGADLRRADLTGAYLTEANLRGANLRGADLTGAQGINKYLTHALHAIRLSESPYIAYKVVNQKYEGKYYGGVKWAVGISLEFENADCDEAEHCSRGGNVATLDWCLREWQKGDKILQIKINNPAVDVAAIPLGTDGKFRVFRGQVVKEMDLVELGLKESEGE